MSQRVSCPHCASALLVPETVRASWLTCPRCLHGMPNPALPESMRGASFERALAVDAEARSDFRGLGCGIVALLTLLIVGAAFLWSFGLAATKSAGRYSDNLFTVWFVVGGIGALLILIVTSVFKIGRAHV